MRNLRTPLVRRYPGIPLGHAADGAREPHRERGDNFFPLCALIGGMQETGHADWWDARVTWQLTPLSLWGSLDGALQAQRGLPVTCPSPAESPAQARAQGRGPQPAKMLIKRNARSFRPQVTRRRRGPTAAAAWPAARRTAPARSQRHVTPLHRSLFMGHKNKILSIDKYILGLSSYIRASFSES